MGFNLTVENYQQATISLKENSKDVSPYFISAKDDFLLGNCFAGIENKNLTFSCLQIKEFYSHIKSQLLEHVIPYLSCFYGQTEIKQHLKNFKLLLNNIKYYFAPEENNEIPYILILQANAYIFNNLIDDMLNYFKYVNKGVSYYTNNKSKKIILNYKDICYNLFVDILFKLKIFEKCNECIIQFILENNKEYPLRIEKKDYNLSNYFAYWQLIEYLIDNWLKVDENLTNINKFNLIFPNSKRIMEILNQFPEYIIEVIQKSNSDLSNIEISLERKLNYVDRNVVFDLDFNNYFDFLII